MWQGGFFFFFHNWEKVGKKKKKNLFFYHSSLPKYRSDLHDWHQEKIKETYGPFKRKINRKAIILNVHSLRLNFLQTRQMWFPINSQVPARQTHVLYQIIRMSEMLWAGRTLSPWRTILSQNILSIVHWTSDHAIVEQNFFHRSSLFN